MIKIILKGITSPFVFILGGGIVGLLVATTLLFGLLFISTALSVFDIYDITSHNGLWTDICNILIRIGSIFGILGGIWLLIDMWKFDFKFWNRFNN